MNENELPTVVLYGDGKTDNRAAFEKIFSGEARGVTPDGRPWQESGGVFRVGAPVEVERACPVCGQDKSADISATLALARIWGLCVHVPDPGGAEMWFPWGRLRLGDECNVCDEMAILKFIREHEEKEKMK